MSRDETGTKIQRCDAVFAAAVTLGAALVVAAIMIFFKGKSGETIGLVMSPAVLGIGTVALRLRERTWPYKLALIGGPLVITFLIGWVAALISRI